ncbi:hypothetical protein SI65_10007 [Aspergillus cristatus]|uniref:Uncharacterized protein n=1 Tax=Aspergillus cristatus TaxID=573508 RepID=A0A1E3B105_ASPCR|nr:hypothetical protein SI65_10007 [Aspergillus cristatus]
MLAPGGSYAEYALAWSHTTFHLPKETSFEEFLDSSKGDCIVDYRNGPEETIQNIRKAAGGAEIRHALDTIVLEQSTHVLRSVVAPGGKGSSGRSEGSEGEQSQCRQVCLPHR